MLTDKLKIRQKLQEIKRMCSQLRDQASKIRTDILQYRPYFQVSTSKCKSSSKQFHSFSYDQEDKENCSFTSNLCFDSFVYPTVSKWSLPQSQLKQEILGMVEQLKYLQKRQNNIKFKCLTENNERRFQGVQECESILVLDQKKAQLSLQRLSCSNKHIYYDGLLNNKGKPQGKGRFVPCCQLTHLYPEVKSYHGEFKNGMFHGLGTLTYSNGIKYVGQFFQNKKKGHGSLYEDTGQMRMGYWEEDKLVRIL